VATATGTNTQVVMATNTPVAVATGTNTPVAVATGTSGPLATTTATSPPLIVMLNTPNAIVVGTLPPQPLIPFATPAVATRTTTPTSVMSSVRAGVGRATRSTIPRLTVSVSPRQLRPGDTFAVTVRYIKWSFVRMAFGYAPHHRLTVTQRADSEGALTLHMRVPTVALHNGHGTATLSVVATSGTRKATTAVGLTLDTMILSPSGARIRGCAQAFTIRVAYASKARVQLVARYPNSHAFFTTWLTTDRHGMATGHFAVSYLSVKARRLTVLVAANGQSGHNRQTEQARITQLVPSACRGV